MLDAPIDWAALQRAVQGDDAAREAVRRLVHLACGAWGDGRCPVCECGPHDDERLLRELRRAADTLLRP